MRVVKVVVIIADLSRRRPEPFNSVVILWNELSTCIQAKDRDENYLITDQQNRLPFNRLTLTVQKNVAFRKKKIRFSSYMTWAHCCFKAPGDICQLTI